MTPKDRLILTTLVALLVGSALGRAELGADTEASVLWARAFQWGVPLAGLAVWPLAPRFGRAGVRGWIIAAAVVATATLAAALVTALMLGRAPLGLLSGQPLALGALAFATGAAQLLARRGQSRK